MPIPAVIACQNLCPHKRDIQVPFTSVVLPFSNVLLSTLFTMMLILSGWCIYTIIYEFTFESHIIMYYHHIILITLSKYLDISFNSHLLSVFIDAFIFISHFHYGYRIFKHVFIIVSTSLHSAYFTFTLVDIVRLKRCRMEPYF